MPTTSVSLLETVSCNSIPALQKKDTVELTIGYHLLEGQSISLKKPLAMLEKLQESLDGQEQATGYKVLLTALKAICSVLGHAKMHGIGNLTTKNLHNAAKKRLLWSVLIFLQEIRDHPLTPAVISRVLSDSRFWLNDRWWD